MRLKIKAGLVCLVSACMGVLLVNATWAEDTAEAVDTAKTAMTETAEAKTMAENEATMAKDEAEMAAKLATEGAAEGAATTAEQADEATAMVKEAAADGSSAPVDTESELYSIKYACSLQELERRVIVDYLNAPESLPCEVNYYKDTETPGEKTTLWAAQNAQGYCEQQAKDFVARLQEWGWSCGTN